MKNNYLTCLMMCVFVFCANLFVIAQTPKLEAKKLLKKTTYKSEKYDFGAGGSITILGSPEGSVSIEGWNKNEVEISAEIEVQAETEADLNLMSAVNGFVTDSGFSNIRILSVGMHDKDYMKKVAKKFPKNLYANPWKINYIIKAPLISDISITQGKGDLTISKIEGAIMMKLAEGNADLKLNGGTIDGTFGNANVTLDILNRSWRGRHINLQVANGSLNIKLPINLNAEIDAKVLRNGQIENLVKTLKPRENRNPFTDKSIAAKAGNGGVAFSFIVGDGSIQFAPSIQDRIQQKLNQ